MVRDYIDAAAAQRGSGTAPDPKLLAVGEVHEDGGGYNRRPETVAVANRGLRDVARGDDFVGDPPDVFALVVTGVGIEIDAQDRREDHRGQILGIVAGLLLSLAEAVMLGEVAVMDGVGRYRDAHRP